MSTLANRARPVHGRRKAPENSSRTAATYGTIPIELVQPRPAIHHHADDDHKLLTPFAFAMAVAVIDAARTALASQRHEQALKAGATNIETEKHYDREFRREWGNVNRARQRGLDPKTPQRQHVGSSSRYKPIKTSVAIRKAGQLGYAEAIKQLKKEPPPAVIKVSITKRALLLLPGLVSKGKNFLQLEAALDRLTEPVTGIKKPLLLSWQWRSGRLELEVNGNWLKPQFMRLPLPLPSHSAATLALFLFLQGVRTGPTNKHGIGFFQLCELIGIGADHRQRDLSRTIASVNRYLDDFPGDIVDELIKLNITLPASYHVEVRGSMVRFIAEPRRRRSADEQVAGGYVRRRRRSPEQAVASTPLAELDEPEFDDDNYEDTANINDRPSRSYRDRTPAKSPDREKRATELALIRLYGSEREAHIQIAKFNKERTARIRLEVLEAKRRRLAKVGREWEENNSGYDD